MLPIKVDVELPIWSEVEAEGFADASIPEKWKISSQGTSSWPHITRLTNSIEQNCITYPIIGGLVKLCTLMQWKFLYACLHTNHAIHQCMQCVRMSQQHGSEEARQISQPHPGQFFIFKEKKKKSCPEWDLNPRHSAVYTTN